MKKARLSAISALHFTKLAVRSLFFIGALLLYIYCRLNGIADTFGGVENLPWLIGVIWIVYAVEMALRFFPSRFESMGCQKQFKSNFIPTRDTVPRLQSARRTLLVAAVWLAFNAVFGVLYLTGVFDVSIMILISLAYGVCDMVCILFFCPFQTWFMKNRCCGDCRIYNWDFAMMFTPYIFIPNLYTWSLLLLSLVLLFRWELTVCLHPERFSEATNASISCASCKEKLCKHKRQLRHLWRNRKIFPPKK